QAQAGQRLLLLEALADAGQHRHVAVGPEDALLALGGQACVPDVAVRLGGSGHDPSTEKEEECRRPGVAAWVVRETERLFCKPGRFVNLSRAGRASAAFPSGSLPLRGEGEERVTPAWRRR